jgi:hypothetical protein
MWFHTWAFSAIERTGLTIGSLVLQDESKQRIGALALQSKFASNVRPVVFDSSVVNGKLRADLLATLSIRNQLHDPAFRWSQIAT